MRTTEQSSLYNDLEQKSTLELLQGMNTEDHKVADAVAKAIPQIEALVDGIVERLKKGGRVFYIGAGTSGRLGIVDASEIPPTFGMFDTFIGLMAGGDSAIRTAAEGAEDQRKQAWVDLQEYKPTANDTVVGIAASGTTPYVIGGLEDGKQNGLLTGCVVCNIGSPVAAACECPVEVDCGPEFVTGSTRLKSGTAQKLILNMISTTAMIKMGRVKGNKMVDMQLTNAKLVDRGTKMIMEVTDITDYEYAKSLLLKYGQVRKAVYEYIDMKNKEVGK